MTRAEADRRAALDAAERLQTMLDAESDAIPCPQCGALTRQMREARSGLGPICMLLLVLGAALLLGVYVTWQQCGHWRFGWAILGAVSVPAGALYLGGRILSWVGGGGANGWQTKVSVKTARGVAYATIVIGLGLIASYFAAGTASLAAGGVAILVGVAAVLVAEIRSASHPVRPSKGEGRNP